MEGIRTDEELMMDYAAGKTEVLPELFSRYKKKMFNYALRLLQDQADAEDAAAGLFGVLSGKKSGYKPEHKFSTWFYSVAHDICVNKLRRQKRPSRPWFKRQTEADEFRQLDMLDKAIGSDRMAKSRDMGSCIRKAVSKLSATEKEMFILREYQNLHYDQIAQILGCPPAKVRLTLYQARQKLKKLLQDFMAEAENV